MTYAKNGASIPIPKVFFNFTSESTDVPGMDGWKLEVVLASTLLPSGEDVSNVETTYEKLQVWEVSGSSDTECVSKVHLEVVKFLKNVLKVKSHEKDGVETSILMLELDHSPSEVLSSSEEEVAQSELAADDQDGWSGQGNDQPRNASPNGEERHFKMSSSYIPPIDEVLDT